MKWSHSCFAVVASIAITSAIAGNPLRSHQSAPQPARDAHVCPPTGITMDGTVVRVIDGDTIVVRSEVEYHVRLLDCWAPETRTKDLSEKQRGLESKARMVALAADKPVRVHIPKSGSELGQIMTMGRILGWVWILTDGAPEDHDLSTVMVNEGFATKTKDGE